jgi:Fucose 4-O-acetylase and related acetyltransferases
MNDPRQSTTATRSTTGTSPSAARSRDPYIDNAKVVLIVLVVVGHLLENVRAGSADGLYTWIYMFHMPAFVVISGYLSRSFTGTLRQCKAIVAILLVPYLVFQVVIGLEDWVQTGHLHLNLFVPRMAMWYLLALAAWRLMTPVLRSIPHPFLISLAVSILSVTFGGVSQDLSAARILSFLPFFTFGLIATPEHVDRFKRIAAKLWLRWALVVFLLGTLLVAYAGRHVIARKWFYMYGGYDRLGLSNVENMLLRTAVLVVAFTLMLAVLALIPQTHTFLTPMGKNTLYVYLLEIVIIYPLMPAIHAWSGWSAPTVAALIVGAVLLALALGTPIVQKATRWLVEPTTLGRVAP